MTGTDWFVLLIPLVYGVFGVFSTEYPRVKALADAAVIGIIFTLIFSIYAEKIPSMNTSMGFMYNITKDSQIYQTFTKAAEVRYQVHSLNDDTIGRLFKGHLRKSFSEFNGSMENMRKKRIDVQEKDAMEFAVNAFQFAAKTIDATSYVTPTSWWANADGSLSNEGIYYINQNSDISKKGVKIRRIFIFNNDEELKTLKSTLDANVDAGVEVRVALASNVPSLARSDLLLVDKKLAGELKIDPIRRTFDGFTATYDDDDVSDIGTRIDIVIRKSQKYEKH